MWFYQDVPGSLSSLKECKDASIFAHILRRPVILFVWIDASLCVVEGMRNFNINALRCITRCYERSSIGCQRLSILVFIVLHWVTSQLAMAILLKYYRNICFCHVTYKKYLPEMWWSTIYSSEENTWPLVFVSLLFFSAFHWDYLLLLFMWKHLLPFLILCLLLKMDDSSGVKLLLIFLLIN